MISDFEQKKETQPYSNMVMVILETKVVAQTITSLGQEEVLH